MRTRRQAIASVFAIAFLAVVLEACSDKRYDSRQIGGVQLDDGGRRSDAVSVSSAEFGIVAAGSGRNSRIVEIRNRTNERIDVLRWDVSCECLSVFPPRVSIDPDGSILVQVVYEAKKGKGEFVGNLKMQVVGVGKSATLIEFYVPVSVVPAKDLEFNAGQPE